MTATIQPILPDPHFVLTDAARAYLQPRGGNAPWVRPIKMTIDEFFQTFRPIKHPTDPEGRTFNGCMFDTFGDDVAFVSSQPSTHVWTLREEEGERFVTPGFGIVNRIGFFVTEIPHGLRTRTLEIAA